MEVVVGPLVSAAGAITKLTQLGFELAGVEDNVGVYRDILRHDFDLLETIRDELKRKHHLLDPPLIQHMSNVIQDSKRAWDAVSSLVERHLVEMGSKGRVTLTGRFSWVFRDNSLAKEVNNYLQVTHVSLSGIASTLFSIRGSGYEDKDASPYGYSDGGSISMPFTTRPLRDAEHGSVRVEDGFYDLHHSPRRFNSPYTQSLRGSRGEHSPSRSDLGSETTACEPDNGYYPEDDSNPGSWIASHHRAMSKRHSLREGD